MGIRFLCDTCGKKLNIKEDLAGKKGRCPKCDAVITIPTESTLPASDKAKSTDDKTGSNQPADDESSKTKSPEKSKASAKPQPPEKSKRREKPSKESTKPTREAESEDESTNPPPVPSIDTDEPVADESQDESAAESELATTDVLADYPNAQWFVRPSSGGQFGPATSDVMKTWLGEGRIGRDSLVWCEGWEEWQPASEVFASELGEPPTPPEDTPPEPKEKGNSAPQLNRAFNHQQARQRARAMGIFLVVALAVVSIALAVTLFIVVNNSAKDKDKNKEDNQDKNESARLFFEPPKNHNLV